MPGSTLRTIMLVWLALWFGIILPGHERGIVRLPGSDRLTCCPTTGQLVITRPDASRAGADGSAKQTPAEPESASGCAICHIVATLASPPALACYEPGSTPVSLLPQLPPADAVVPFAFAANSGRAPPAV